MLSLRIMIILSTTNTRKLTKISQIYNFHCPWCWLVKGHFRWNLPPISGSKFLHLKFLHLAFLDECFQTNKDYTKQLLTYNLENWGGKDCLSMACDIRHEEFMAHVSCQGVLTEIWTGHMKTSQNSSLKVRPDILSWAKKIHS